jgi:hypothetical protein
MLSKSYDSLPAKAWIKDWHRIATRYDRCVHTFSAICIAAAVAFYLY